MEAFPNPPLFDLSQASTFSQLPDDDFLALLQKQFPGSAHNNLMFGGFENSVNPQNLTQYNMPITSPSSEDTSPSPPNTNKNDHHKEGSEEAEDTMESALKRKASDDDFEEGPSSKNQHIGSSRRASTSKRKSSGSGADESRALKRKEQNRAAQRAFRERKEKHVRDLEDQVAALEAKNDAATTENENLRDLLTRLQTENMTLRQQASASTFTFTVPKSAAAASPPSVSSPQSTYLTNASIFSTLPRMTYSSPNLTNPNPLDMTSLMSFNPSVLNLIDETPQQTATDGAMNMDIGYNQNKQNTTNNGSWFPSNLTTLATNPAYFSMASMYDSPSPQTSASAPTPASIPAATPTSMPASDQSAFSFDMNSLTQWPTNADGGTLDDLFGGYFSSQPTMDVDMLLRSPPVIGSPVVHQNRGSPHTSASSSPASHTSEPSLFSAREGSSSESEMEHGDNCPKSKADLVQHIAAEGSSPFANMSCPETFRAMHAGNIVPTEHERQLMQSVSCRKSTTGFPTTQMNANNVEVLTAWRSITKDPNFKDSDISKLCSEFASKARCDGTKVVLEPDGVQDIRETLSRKY